MATILCQRCRRETEAEITIPSAVGELDLRTLPWVDMSEYMHLPICGGVYFAVADRGMCYIGQSENLNVRWRHHPMLERFALEREGRILWIEIHDKGLRRQFERDAIKRFRPLWNRGAVEHISGSIRDFVKRERLRRFFADHTSHAFNRELHPNFVAQKMGA